MRHFLAAGVVAVFASTVADAKGQYPPAQVQPRPPAYRYALPGRPVYIQNHSVVPRYVSPPNPTGYVNRPYYGAYGYGNYSNGSTDGFPPFRSRRSR